MSRGGPGGPGGRGGFRGGRGGYEGRGGEQRSYVDYDDPIRYRDLQQNPER